MTDKPEITDDDISAYLDGALDPARLSLLETRMADDRALSEKIERLREQDESLSALFAPFAQGDAADLPPVAPARSRWKGWAVAAGLVFAFGLGGGGGYASRSPKKPVQIEKETPEKTLDFACALGALVATFDGGTPQYSLQQIEAIRQE
jgi:anti-sigma factor RsiW